MMELHVECYAGYRGEQRPLRFRLGERMFEVKSVEDQWYGPSSRFFRVRADDDNVYILRHEEEQDIWVLDAFRRT
jgi:hypothetical protein